MIQIFIIILLLAKVQRKWRLQYCYWIGSLGNSTGSRNVALGYMSGANDTSSNKLHISNGLYTTGSGEVKDLIYGDFLNETVGVNGDMEVNL